MHKIARYFLRILLFNSKKMQHETFLLQRLDSMMGFSDPNLFDIIEYQKEAIVVLMASAHKTQKAWKKYSKNPDNNDLERGYQLCRNIYKLDVETLMMAHVVFKDLEIHWSKLPEFIRRWKVKNSMMWDQKMTKEMGLLEVT